MVNKHGKVDFHLWAHPKTLDLVKKYTEEEGLKTQSMFIERAIRFYCGYLATNAGEEYLARTLYDLLDVYIGELEDKLCNMMFKNAVELGMFLHVYCALNDVTEENLEEVHDAVMKEVRSTYGMVSMRNILKFQNSMKD